MKILIIGHGRHGKDTVAEILARDAGLSFASSSEFACEKVVFPLMADLYDTPAECYADRANHRELWYHAIAAYNLRPGPSLTEQILAGHDVYVGMRRRDEFDNSRHLFGLVVWVDRPGVPPELEASNALTRADADLIIYNSGTLADLDVAVAELVALLDDTPE